ncbi:MAG: pilin [Patescibacteria group bacterium]|nr:pilin [Patescibacteria group bacterium]MDD3435262.1 pilin [Patescibacteria group bacterium]MDD4466250.1 pilin [Patescibacteria group bacterium]
MKNIFYSIIIGLFLILPNIVSASLATTSDFNSDKIDSQTKAFADAAGISQTTSLAFIIATIIQVLLGFLGVIFLILTIVSGFKWMTAQGNDDEVKKAKKTLTNAVIGLVVVLAAYIITSTLFRILPFGGGGGGVAGG